MSWPGARGILHAGAARQRLRYARRLPAPVLAPFVEHYWIVEYDLRGQPPYPQRVLPHPSVNLTVTGARSRIAGVIRGHYTETLTGAGRVLGVRFRPGGFRPFLGGPVAGITDRFLPLPEVFGPAAEPAARRIAAGTEPAGDGTGATDEDLARLMDEFLLAARPVADPVVDQVAALVGTVRAEPGIRRVTDLAGWAGVGVRALQRRFAEYVGVGPKWVIRRYRLHEAAERAAGGGPVDWAGLAVELGYSDQAHFVRDFTAQVGLPPARYAERCAAEPGDT